MIMEGVDLEAWEEKIYTNTRPRFKSCDCFSAHVKIILVYKTGIMNWKLDTNIDLNLEVHQVDQMHRIIIILEGVDLQAGGMRRHTSKEWA